MENEFVSYIENAITWAEERLGNDKYGTRCLAFVEDAYEKANAVEIFGGSSAKESADEYGASQNGGVPPRGAFVFYDCFGTLFDTYNNWGHVGLSLGDGRIIHAWDQVREDSIQDVETLEPARGWTQPRYIGWAPVERVFQGYRKKG